MTRPEDIRPAAVRDRSVHDELSHYAMELERRHGLRLESVTFRWNVVGHRTMEGGDRVHASLVGCEVASKKGLA